MENLNIQLNQNDLSVAEFYKGKQVFVTGGMGFLGKVIIEKLLRSCPDIDKIFLLVRSKKDKTINDRIEEVISSPAFDVLREKDPNALNKIALVEGDVSHDGLGMSQADRQMLCDNISVIIHSAATINFNEPMKTAVMTNIQSVKEMLTLARGVRNLKSFVHVSTAYTNWFEMDVKEQFYSTEFDPNDIIQLCRTMDDKTLNKITPCLLGKHVNTYTFTKSLAEQLVARESHDLPVTIIRPSMVIGSIQEPMPGWIDSWAGPTVYAFMMSKGLLRAFHLHGKTIGDIIPVDMVVNMIIAAGWKVGTEKLPQTTEKLPTIYHSVTGADNPIYWRQFFHLCRDLSRKYPLSDVLWYPTIRMRQTNAGAKIDSFVTQYISAYLADLATLILGKKPKMIRTQNALNKNYDIVKFAVTNPIKFENKNSRNLVSSMSQHDQQEFNFDVRKINWKNYIESYYLGSRKYLWNQKSTDFVAGRRKVAKLKMANYFVMGSTLAASLLLIGGTGKILLNNKNEPKDELKIEF